MTANEASHRPYLQPNREDGLAHCLRCHGGEAELEEKSCSERKPWTPAERFAHLVKEVAEWSYPNFGMNHSKWNPCIRLHHVAPLLGLIEEACEMSEAMTEADHADAIGDQMIYFADYVGRIEPSIGDVFQKEEFWLSIRAEIINILATKEWANLELFANSFQVTLGKIVHANLKRHQGIRGFDHDKHFIPFLTKHLSRYLAVLALSSLAGSPERGYHMQISEVSNPGPMATHALNTLLQITETTWEAVKQRNWQKNKATGTNPE